MIAGISIMSFTNPVTPVTFEPNINQELIFLRHIIELNLFDTAFHFCQLQDNLNVDGTRNT